jgi:lipoprotein signal peptidase
MSLLLRMRCWLAAQEIMRLAALIGIAAFLADWASKSWAVAALTHATPTLDSLLLAPAHNDAFAFSAGADRVASGFVMGARLVALYGVGVLFGRVVVRDRRSAAGFGLLLGGGFGNTADLAFRGAVVDFINVGPFTFDFAGELMNLHFVFNGADLAILFGIALLAPRIRSCALEAQRRIGEWETRMTRDLRLFP